MPRICTHQPFGIAASLFLTIVCMGCGGGNTAAPDNSASANSATQANATTTTTQPGTSTDSGRPETPGDTQTPRDKIWTDAEGHQYLGSVPLDAFYDRPLEVVQDGTPLAGVARPGTMSAGTAASPTMIAASGTPNGGSQPAVPAESANQEAETASADSWDQMISIEDIDQEITAVRNFLTATLQSVGSYNSSMLMIEQKAATVAVLAHILTQHSGQLAWKEDAAYIRDLAARMNESPLQRGKKDQVRLQQLFENMIDIFNRSRPADLETPSPDTGFSDVAEMSSVMKRMAEAEKKMKVEAGSENAFKSMKDMVRHEAAILGTFTSVIAREEYGYGDDPEFTGYANKIIEATQTIRNSTETEDFNSFQLALSTISSNCQSCHSAFKNN